MKRLLILLALVSIAPCYILAQFTYIGGGPSFSLGTISKGANYSRLDLDLFAMTRPIRNLGIGFSIGLPLTQSNSAKARSISQNYFSGSYTPGTMKYNFRGEMRKTLLMRIFFEKNLVAYLDARVNFNSFSEELIFQRGLVHGDSYYGWPDSPPISINDRATYRVTYPGFAIGIMPHLSRSVYLDWNIGVDLLSTRARRFIHIVAYDQTFSDGIVRNTTISNPFDGSFTLLFTSLSIGYFF